MTRAFSQQNSVSLCPTSFCTPRTNLPVTPGISRLPTFAFQSPMMKRTCFFGVSSRRSYRSLYNGSTSASLTLVVGAQTWITVILNGLPWKQIEIILLSLRLHPSTAFRTLVDYQGYSIFSKGFLPQQQIKWSSELNSPTLVHFSSLIPKMSISTLAHLVLPLAIYFNSWN